jgi:hypothetical protein
LRIAVRRGGCGLKTQTVNPLRNFASNVARKKNSGWNKKNMTSEDLKVRSKKFALRVIRLVDSLPKNVSSDVLGKQILRSATSVAANYRAACRARSQADFISKITVVEEKKLMKQYSGLN